jgi:hypothetical protein
VGHEFRSQLGQNTREDGGWKGGVEVLGSTRFVLNGSWISCNKLLEDVLVLIEACVYRTFDESVMLAATESICVTFILERFGPWCAPGR